MSWWLFDEADLKVQSGEQAVLGKGAFGEVRRASWRGLPCAAKRLHLLLTKEALAPSEIVALKKAFVSEMEMMARLRHPNLVQYLGMSTKKGPSGNLIPGWIVTELMETSLYNLLHEQHLKLTLFEVVHVATQIARGLQYLHTHSPQILHRDISAKNILISGPRTAIADLGQAKFVQQVIETAASSGGEGAKKGALTDRRGDTAAPGTLVYSAPEVLTGKYTAAIDVFSFGVLVVEMLTGRFPSIERRSSDVEAACEAAPVLAPTIRACLSLSPEGRPSTPQLLAWLEDIAKEEVVKKDAWVHRGGIAIERVFRREIEAAVARGHSVGIAATMPRVEAAETSLARMKELYESESGRGQELDRLLTMTTEKLQNAIRDNDELKTRVRKLEGQVSIVEGQAEMRILRARGYAEELEAKLREAEREAEVAKTDTLEERAERQKLESALANITKRTRKQEASEVIALQKAQVLSQLVESLEKRNSRLEEALAGLRNRVKKAENESNQWKLRSDELQLRVNNEKASRKVAEHQLKEIEDTKKLEIERLMQSLPHAMMKNVSFEAPTAEHGPVLAGGASMGERGNATDTSLLSPHSSSRRRSWKKTQKRTSSSPSGSSGTRGPSEAVAAEVQVEWAAKDEGDEAVEADLFHASVSNQSDNDTYTEASTWSNEEKAEETSGMFPPLNASTASADGSTGHASPLKSPLRKGTHTLSKPRVSSVNFGTTGPEVSMKKAKELVKTAMAGGIKQLLFLLHEYSGQTNIAWGVCAALKDAAYKSGKPLRAWVRRSTKSLNVPTETARIEIASQGGIGALLSIARTPSSPPRVIEYMCRALMNIIYGNDNNRNLLVASGGVTAILSIMKTYEQEEGVISAACGALANLGYGSETTRGLIAKEGGIVLVLHVLKRYIRSRRVVSKGLWMLLVMSSDETNAIEIAMSGGISVIVNSIRASVMDPTVARFGCWALANVVWSSSEIQERAIIDGAVSACHEAIRGHPGNESIQEQARLVLEKIASSAATATGNA